MRNTKTLLSLAVASALGVAALPAHAAGPSLYGDISVAFDYVGSAGAGTSSGYGLHDNVSIFGFKGDAAAKDGTKYFYDFNWILDGGSPGTHLSIIGMEGGMGTLTIGMRDNGLFENMVNAGIYSTNWYYTPGMTSLQVSKSIKYVSKASGGFQFGVQAFDISNGTAAGDKATTNFTAAGTYATGSLSFAAGYTSYAEYGDGTTQYSASLDSDQLGTINDFAGLTIKSITGVSASYKSGKLGVVGAYDMRKPMDNSADTSTVNTLMVTGTYAYTDKTNLIANISNTKQSGGVKGTVITLMASYAAEPYLTYTVEFQNSNKDANAFGIPATTFAGGSKSSNAIALGAAYSF